MENTDTKTRQDYLRDIIMRLQTNEVFLPTAEQERSYKEALDHVARVISNDCNVVQPYRSGCGVGVTKRGRKECLKEVLRVLQAMEHRRVYDPPGDSEIRYYLVIRKYIRSLLTFFGSEVQPVFHEGSCCLSTITGLHHLEELAEVRRHLASFSASVSEMDIKNSYTPLMGIEYRLQQGPRPPPPAVNLGSRGREIERSSAFYFHKFLLAFFDLRSHSLLYYCPPSMEEKISYLQVLDCTPPPTPGAYMVQFSTKVDVYSDYSRCLVIERMKDDINDLEKHCLGIIDTIMTKLSLTLSEPWDALVQRWYWSGNSEAAAVVLSRELIHHEKYDHVSIEDIPAYITHVQRGIRLACQAYYFLSGRFHDNERMIYFFNSSNCFDLEDPSEIIGICEATLQGWALLHALTILNYGSRDDFDELSILNNPMIQAHPEREREREREREHANSTGRLEKEEINVKRLTGIIEDLNVIGDSDTLPDEEEIQLLHKIWQGVASAVAFFIHALAYEQQESVIKGHPLFGAGAGRMKFMKSAWRPGLKPAEERKKDCASLRKLQYQMNNVQANLMCFRKLLYAFEKGLLEKLETALAEKESHCTSAAGAN